MLEAGYVPIPRGYTTPENAALIEQMKVKKTGGNNKKAKENSCAQPKE